MGIERRPTSKFYYYTFKHEGLRYSGSTQKTTEREALAVEKAEKAKVKASTFGLPKGQPAPLHRASSAARTLKEVCQRYFDEVGQHHSGHDNTLRDLNRLVQFFGEQRDITTITDNDVARLVTWRRKQRVPGKGPEHTRPFLQPATINRSTTEVLKKLFTRAKVWRVRFEYEPRWRDHWLEEPEERVREFYEGEAERLTEETRDDYAPILAFARATGFRRKTCALLCWQNVNWQTGWVTIKGKGRKTNRTPITNALRAILWPLREHASKPTDPVFTYVAQRTQVQIGKRPALVKGRRYPMTVSGLKTAWRRLRAKAGLDGKDGTDSFRFHDFRHDLGTKALREGATIMDVQKMLNHSKATTTMKYLHAADQDIRHALEARAASWMEPRPKLKEVRRAAKKAK